MSGTQVSAEFVGEAGQRIFILAHHPNNFSGECVLVCPPFAEEMNKSRRMLTELAQYLAQKDIGLVIPDLYGTGDSEGDFADASIDQWIDDLACTEKWIESKGWRVESVLGIRLGCLLALRYLATKNMPKRRVFFWQPVLDGARALDQFLRLRVAASLMADKKETVVSLKARVSAEKKLEISGYTISESLVKGTETLKLDMVGSAGISKLHWFEVLRDLNTILPLPVQNTIKKIKSMIDVELESVLGEPFWTSTDVTVNRELIDKTATLLLGPK